MNGERVGCRSIRVGGALVGALASFGGAFYVERRDRRAPARRSGSSAKSSTRTSGPRSSSASWGTGPFRISDGRVGVGEASRHFSVRARRQRLGAFDAGVRPNPRTQGYLRLRAGSERRARNSRLRGRGQGRSHACDHGSWMRQGTLGCRREGQPADAACRAVTAFAPPLRFRAWMRARPKPPARRTHWTTSGRLWSRAETPAPGEKQKRRHGGCR